MSNVCCLFSPLLRNVFLRVLRSGYSAPGTPLCILRSCPLLKNHHHFEIPIHPGIISWRKNHLVDVPPLNHFSEYLLLLIILFIYIAYAAPLHFSRTLLS